MVTRAARGSRWLGLDFGSRVLKLVELEQGPAGVQLRASLVQELPQGSADRVGWLQTALKEFEARHIHVALGGENVALRRIHVPPMSSAELPEAVKWQVKDQLPFPVQEAVLDFRVIGDVWDKDVKQQDVLVAAAARAAAAAAASAVERAGGKPASLTPLQYALWRCVSVLMPGAQQGAVAVVEFGSQGTDVVIAKDGQVRLSRHLSLGTDSVAEAMVGVVATDRGDVSIDRSKAEAIQRQYGIFAEGAEGATEDGVPFFHLASLMRSVLEKLLTELSRVLDFYKVQMDEAGVSRLLLCGAGATLKQLPAYVGEGLGMPADIFNPLLHIPGGTASLTPEALADRGPRLVAAMGAALDRGHGLDLMSGGTRQTAAGRQAWSRLAIGAAAAAAAGAVLLGLAALLLQWQVQGQEQVWRHLEGPYAESRQVADKQAAFESTNDRLQLFIDRQPVWEAVFCALSNLVPASVQLEELTVNTQDDGKYRLHLAGRAAASGQASSGADIATFIDALDSSPFFAQAALSTSEMHAGDAGWTQFELETAVE